MRHFLLLIVGISLFLPYSLFAGPKSNPRLQQVVDRMAPSDVVSAWVYFADKGRYESMRSAIPMSVVTDRALRRRAKVRRPDALVDYGDLPVDQSYVDQVSSTGATIRERLKWFNSVSVTATRAQLDAIGTLPCVSHLDLLAKFRRSPVDITVPAEGTPAPSAPAETHSFNYGASLGQVEQINVPVVHDSGNYAQGVVLGVFDNGFRLLNHEAFSTMEILATYDFVDHKVSVAPNNPSTSFGSHGVNTLSTIGGNAAGNLIGPAFGATFILARTENDSSETPYEEDKWAAAIEWAESLGVDVTSTSLGYLDYDLPFTSWTWENMDGNTTVITRAADLAVAHGVVVVNSAGNDGDNPGHNTLGAPADGDSVLSIGAVTPTGNKASFSSVGPTTSSPPRIKPDVMAQGTSVRVASSTNPSGYGTSQGTSFSCPLAAGVAALVVKARPNATPVEVGNAMRMTASNAGSPNNQFGWGILNAAAAIAFLQPSTGVDLPTTLPAEFSLDQNYPNPFNPSTVIGYRTITDGDVTLIVCDILGRRVATLADEFQTAGDHRIQWNAGNLAGGVYYCTLTSGSRSLTQKMMLVK